MKNVLTEGCLTFRLPRGFFIISLLTAWLVWENVALGQSSAFTYQGVLRDGTNMATGLFDVMFRLFDQADGGTQQGPAIPAAGREVEAGRFTVELDFGPVFDGSPRWLEISVKQAGASESHTVLTPRQRLTAQPYAIHAETSTAFHGQVSDAQLSSNVARLDANQTFTGNVRFTSATGSFVGDGVGLTNVSLPVGGSLPEMDGGNLTNVLQPSVNLHQVKQVFNALYRQTNFNLACVGDSVAWLYFGAMRTALTKSWGHNGTAFGTMASWVSSPDNEFIYRDTPGVKSFPGPDTNWFAAYCEIPAGESRTYTNRASEAGWPADRIEAYYSKHSEGGVFALQVSTNGQPYGTALIIDTQQAGKPGGGVVSLSLPRGLYRYRVLGVAGITRLIDTGVYDTRSPGLRASWLFQGGITIQHFLAVSNIAVGILPSLKLTGVFVSLKDAHGDITPSAFSQSWPHFETLLNQCFPDADIIYVGATPQLQNDANLIWQDQFVRARALATGRAYFDSRSRFGSAESVIALQLADILGVHLTRPGAVMLADWLLQDLGLANASMADERATQSALFLRSSPTLPSAKTVGPLGACFWNSNGTVYLLTARPDGFGWASTNRIGP